MVPRRTSTWGALGVAVILVLPGCGEPQAPQPTAPIAPPTAPQSAAPSPRQEEPEGEVLRFEVRAGERVTGPAELEVEVGAPVVLEVVSDVADELHVHGYDLAADLMTGELGRLRFVADVPGIFEVELHESGPLTRLRVVP